VGYLPYSIVDGFQPLRKDFAYWRALTKAIETAQTPESGRGLRRTCGSGRS
jgi:hypothetical protein